MPKAKHIVIVDGCEMNRSLIKLVLGAEGFHRLTETSHYPEVLSVLRAYKTHLLILAQEINGLSTSDLVRQIRQGLTGGKPNIPIIVLADPLAAGGPGDHLSERCDAAGRTVFVAKPISIKKLHPVIMDLLTGRKEPGERSKCKERLIAGTQMLCHGSSSGQSYARSTQTSFGTSVKETCDG